MRDQGLNPARIPGREATVRLGRWVQLLAGLAACGLAITLMIRSGLGLGPWDAFHVGLGRLAGVSVGSASIAVGILVIGIASLIGVRPGPGTLANMILIGVFIDWILPAVPNASGWWMLGYHVAGILLFGFATGMYMGAGLGHGPRDGLMLAVSVRTSLSVRRVRTLTELTVLVLGWWMGAAIGMGTVLFAVAIGPVVQWSLRAFGVATPADAVTSAVGASVAADEAARPASSCVAAPVRSPDPATEVHRACPA